MRSQNTALQELLTDETHRTLLPGKALGILQDDTLQQTFELAHVIHSVIYKFLQYCWENDNAEISLLKTGLSATCGGIVFCSAEERSIPPGISGAILYGLQILVHGVIWAWALKFWFISHEWNHIVSGAHEGYWWALSKTTGKGALHKWERGWVPRLLRCQADGKAKVLAN